MKTYKSLGRWIRKYAFEMGIAHFVAVAGLLWYTGAALKERIQWVDHTQRILTELYDVSADIERAETSQRGYILVGYSNFLETYHQALRDIAAHLQIIKAQTEDNVEQSRRIATLDKLIKKRIGLMDEVIEVNRKSDNHSVARNLISDPERIQLAESIRSLVSETIQEEKRLLAERQEDAAAVELLLIVFATTGAFLAVGLVIASRVLMKRDHFLLSQSSAVVQKQRQMLDSIINSMSEGLVVVDNEGRYTQVNKASEAVLGEPGKVLATKDITVDFGFFNPDTKEKIKPEDLPSRRALRGLATDNCEILVVNEMHPKGAVISTNGRPLLDSEGKIVGAISVFRDVSHQKEIERERILAREAAIEASKKKSEFLATMSHEIRTPMNGIIGMATLMLDTKMNSEQFDFVSTIKESAESLLSLINGILDHSKIESGKLVLHKFDFDFRRVGHDIFEMFKYSAREKSLSLNIVFDENDNWGFHGDADRIRQMLINLVGNAVKFTEKGSVTVRLSQHQLEGKKTRIRGEVIDTGPGLTASEMSQIFSKYIQTAAGQAKGGSGLGLMISKQLAQLMNGDMGVMSQVGEGSCFWFEIELEDSVKENPLQKSSNLGLPKMTGHILIAEDQPVNVRIVSKFLEKIGFTFEVAVNGKEAVEKYKNGDFDLVLMDCRMPIMSGYDATRLIRQYQNENNDRKPILALTAEGSSGDRRLCLEAGMDEVLSKPIDVQRFVEMLSKYLSTGSRVFDLSALERLKDLKAGDEDLTTVLIADFFESAPNSISDIFRAAKAGDLTLLQDTAHGLKSAAAALGAMRLSEKCYRLEKLQKLSGETLALCEELEKEFKLAKIELEAFVNGTLKKAA